MAGTIGVAVVERWVLRLAGIFQQGAEAAFLETHTRIPGVDIHGQTELVGGIHHEVFLALALVHP